MKNTKILTFMMALGLIGSNAPIHGMEKESLEERLARGGEFRLTEEEQRQQEEKYDAIRKEMRDQIDQKREEYDNRIKKIEKNPLLTPNQNAVGEIDRRFLEIKTKKLEKDDIKIRLDEIDTFFHYLSEKEKKRIELSSKFKNLLEKYKDRSDPFKRPKGEVDAGVTGPVDAGFSVLADKYLPKYGIPQLNYYFIDHLLNQIGLTAEEEDRIKEIKNEMEKLEDISGEDLPPEKYKHNLYYHLIAGFLPIEKLKKMATHARKRQNELKPQAVVYRLRKAWAKMKAEKKEKEVAGPSKGKEPVAQPVVQPVAEPVVQPVVQPSEPESFLTDANLGRPIPERISIIYPTREEYTYSPETITYVAYKENPGSTPVLARIEKSTFDPKKIQIYILDKFGSEKRILIAPRHQHKKLGIPQPSGPESAGPS